MNSSYTALSLMAVPVLSAVVKYELPLTGSCFVPFLADLPGYFRAGFNVTWTREIGCNFKGEFDNRADLRVVREQDLFVKTVTQGAPNAQLDGLLRGV